MFNCYEMITVISYKHFPILKEQLHKDQHF
jgi:hypothetical protein